MNHIQKDQTTIIAPNATVTGDVELGKNVNIWHGAVIRGDHGKIQIGEGTNIQDNCILHSKTTVGAGCTVGHGAIVHGCTVGEHCLIGMGAVILSGAVIGNHCVIGAGAVVTENTEIPDRSIVMGVPGRVVAPIRQSLIDHIYENEIDYINLAKDTFL